jgi:hypothetical protein
MVKKAQIDKITVLLIFILIILLIFLSYFLYLNLPRNPKTLDITLKDISKTTKTPSLSEVNQFYPNMKFNHNQITFKINNDCDEENKESMVKAFKELSNKVNKLKFLSTNSNPDITISCSQNSNDDIGEKHFIAGEGGAKEIIQTGRYNIVTEGVIFLYENLGINTINCDYPNVALHELMHVFGFDHSDDKNSLMNPLLESCDQILDQSIINQLNLIYSEENLPDLYFETMDATKRGRYLDFDLIVKNSGSIESDNATLIILEDGKQIEKRNLGKLSFGAGISLATTNLKLRKLNPDKIQFVIDKNDQIKEIDEENNLAEVNL